MSFDPEDMGRRIAAAARTVSMSDQADAHETSVAATAPRFELVRLADLTPSSTRAQIERREHFDDGALRELAASIASVGILQPLVVRPSRHPRGGYEIVAGERRFLAAQIAGIEMVPANVVALSDEQLIEAQLVENLQREGLHELAEAEGYEALLHSHAFTVDDLVAKFGKSRAYIYGRMKLLALCPEARAAFYAGKLSASTALLIARIPTPHVQLEALRELTDGEEDPMTYREARGVIENRFMLRLLHAPWDLDDRKLVPSAGSCNACPKRTGNQPDLFGDVAYDMCTDSACFGEKRAAARAREIKQLRKSGATVIQGDEAVALFDGQNPRWAHLDGYRRADQLQEDLVAQLEALGAKPVYIDHPQLPDLLKVWREADFRRASAELHDARAAARGAAVGDAAEDEDEAPRETTAERNARIDRETAFRAQLHQIVRERITTPPSRSDIEAIAIELVQQLLDAGWDHLVQLWGWEMDDETQHSPEALEQFLRERISALSDAEINRLFLDARVVSELRVNFWGGDQVPRRLLEAASAAGIDAEAVRAELGAEAQESSGG